MTERKDGGPAFPSHGTMGEVVQEGISLRDLYAGMAMEKAARGARIRTAAEIAKRAYFIADAMLAEKAKVS